MIDWEEDIALSERVFVRASTHGKKSFWGYEGAILDKADSRIRVFPFPTRRPVSCLTARGDMSLYQTLQECLRCWHELVRTKISHLSSDALQALDEAYIASLQPKKQVIKPVPSPAPVTTPVVHAKSPEELAREDRQRRLGEMIRKGRLEALRPFWEKWHDEFDASVLGIAASSGQEEVLRYLLEEVRLDPTTPLDGKRAYDLCSTRGARNVFRRIRHDHPDWYDWTAAHVPVGLSEEMEEKQDTKKAERRKGLREKLKEREKARSEVEEKESPRVEEVDRQRMVPVGGGANQKLGGREAGGLSGMSEEMRLKVERERRARAAEERFKKLG